MKLLINALTKFIYGLLVSVRLKDEEVLLPREFSGYAADKKGQVQNNSLDLVKENR